MQKPIMFLALALLASNALAVKGQPGGGIMRMDSDGDGMVSREEFQPPEQHRGPRMLERADIDGDGNVTRDEIMAAIDEDAEERKARMSGQMLLMFEEADTDSDGVLTPMEALDHAFLRVDANGDGYITEEEAQQLRDKRGKRAERGGRRD
jgi:Ca2+-binding EF-hand superfamily protein